MFPNSSELGKIDKIQIEQTRVIIFRRSLEKCHYFDYTFYAQSLTFQNSGQHEITVQKEYYRTAVACSNVKNGLLQ